MSTTLKSLEKRVVEIEQQLDRGIPMESRHVCETLAGEVGHRLRNGCVFPSC